MSKSRNREPAPRFARLAGVVAVVIATVPAARAGAQEAVAVLPETVVTATRIETPYREVASSVSVITGEELERRQVRQLSDALRTVPSAVVSASGGFGSATQVRLRGAEGNQTLVLIDGIEVNDPAGGSEFNFGDLLAADVERVEVLRGPQSALYGSDAMGGVINIVSKRPRPGFTVKSSVEGGSLRTGQARVAASGGGERFDAAFSGVRFHTDGISAAAESGGNGEQDSDDNTTIAAKLRISPLAPLDIDLVGRYTKTRVQTDGFVGGLGAVDDDTETDSRQRFARAQATLGLFDGAWEHSLGAAFSQDDRENRDGGAFDSVFKGERVKLDYRSNLFFETATLIDAAHTATVALEHEEENVISQSAFTDVDRGVATDSLVGQYQLGLLDRLFLTGAVRHDDNDFFDDATTWRATAAYVLDSTGTKLKGSYGTAVKNPTLFELFGFASTFSGNPDLRPEDARGWDAGIEQRLFDDRLAIDVTYFDLRIEDLILGFGTTAVNLAGETRTRGVEVALTARPWPGLDLGASYTFLHARDANGDRLFRRPEHQASLTAAYRFLDDRADIDLGAVFVGPRDDVGFDALFTPVRVRLDPYVVVNLAGRYRLTDRVALFARVENLFDETYQEVFTFGRPGVTAFAGLSVRY